MTGNNEARGLSSAALLGMRRRVRCGYYNCTISRGLRLTETEGSALLAAIYHPNDDTHRWYMWADGKWVRNNHWQAGHTLGAFPLRCHETFNALKGTVESLSKLEKIRLA